MDEFYTLKEEDIVNSIELEWERTFVKNLLIMFAVTAVVFTAIALFILLSSNLNKIFLVVPIWFLVFFIATSLPSILHSKSKTKDLTNNFKNYKKYEAVIINATYPNHNRNMMYYTLKMETESGAVVVKTTLMTINYLESTCGLKDYHNIKLLVLYNQDKNKVYLIKKISNFGSEGY